MAHVISGGIESNGELWHVSSMQEGDLFIAVPVVETCWGSSLDLKPFLLCLQATKGLGQSWLAAALAPLPQHAASNADKQAILDLAQAAANGDNKKG